jgi:hypothetical protein
MVMPKWPTCMVVGATVWRDMVASADMAAVDMAVAVDMAAVVAAIADGTDWDRQRSLRTRRRARPFRALPPGRRFRAARYLEDP